MLSGEEPAAALCAPLLGKHARSPVPAAEPVPKVTRPFLQEPSPRALLPSPRFSVHWAFLSNFRRKRQGSLARQLNSLRILTFSHIVSRKAFSPELTPPPVPRVVPSSSRSAPRPHRAPRNNFRSPEELWLPFGGVVGGQKQTSKAPIF